MATAISANKAELLAIADSVAREKLIDREIVIEAMEDAIQRAARARYGAENDIRAKIDPKSGDMRLWRVVEVVELVDDYFKQVSVADARAFLELLRALEVDLLEMVFRLFDDLEHAPQAQVAGLDVELGADVVLGTVAGAGGALDRVFHRLDDNSLVD